MQKAFVNKILGMKCIFHSQNNISKICLQTACVDNCLICILCSKESKDGKQKSSHFGHVSRDLKEVLEQIQHNTSSACLNDSTVKVDTLKERLIITFQRTQQLIIEYLHQSKKKFQAIFVQAKSRMNKSFDAVSIRIEELNKLLQSNVNQNNFRNLSKIMAEFASQKHITSNIYDMVMTKATVAIESFLTNVEMLLEQQFLSPATQKLFSEQCLKVGQLNMAENATRYWSESLKGDRLLVNGPRIERKGDNNWMQGMALSNQPISASTKTIWGYKIYHYSYYCIYLGMALKTLVIKNKYSFQNRASVGHGCYMIDTNGNSFSHSEKEFNNVYAMKQFNKNQSALFLVFDPTKNKLYFRIPDPNSPNWNVPSKGDSKFQLNVISPPRGDYYYRAVFLRGINNSVEMISDDIKDWTV